MIWIQFNGKFQFKYKMSALFPERGNYDYDVFGDVFGNRLGLLYISQKKYHLILYGISTRSMEN